MFSKLVDKFNNDIKWRSAVMGDGNEIHTGESLTNSFVIKQGRYGWEMTKTNRNTKQSLYGTANDYDEAVAWCRNNNG